jgi:hypothetical protein
LLWYNRLKKYYVLQEGGIFSGALLCPPGPACFAQRLLHSTTRVRIAHYGSKRSMLVSLHPSLGTGIEWQPCPGRDPGEQCVPLALDTGAMSHCSCPPLWLTRACSQVLRDRRIIRLVGAAAVPLLNGPFPFKHAHYRSSQCRKLTLF